MGIVIQFPTTDPHETQAKLMMTIADEIDGLILLHLDSGDVDPRDLAGLIAHRLGSLMRHLEGKSKLWDVCEKVLKAQAAIE